MIEVFGCWRRLAWDALGFIERMWTCGAGALLKDITLRFLRLISSHATKPGILTLVHHRKLEFSTHVYAMCSVAIHPR